MNLFFGDSLTSGENNNFKGYVEKLIIEEDYKNYGVSGTCIGDYSLYPVGENNLLQLLYKKKSEIKKADKIFLEYGSNDISAVAAKYTSFSNVEIELIKSVDLIKQINESIEIYFITIGSNFTKMAAGQCAYLNDSYLKNTDIKIAEIEWIDLYQRFVNFLVKLDIKILTLPHLLEEEIDTDGIHPNDAGYEKIAQELRKQVIWKQS